MGLFDDFSKFLEARLDEFLQEHPELELWALEEQLREQETDIRRSIADLKAKEKRLQDSILETAQDVQRWHQRIVKVEAAGEVKLAEAAREREAALLRQGNQLWGQMEGVKARIVQAQDLLNQVEARLREVKIKANAARSPQATETTGTSNTAGWGQSWSKKSGGADPLEQKFQQWEMDDELAQLKRNMGK
ncbi:MAG: TIGR04376 family protein [Cyanobacteria bacterium P01_D01_bin.73]